MENQKLRNLTTGILHTNMGDIYDAIEFITGEKGVMTHMLPNAFRAMHWWLKEKLTDGRFWNGKFDTTHTGETQIEPMSQPEKQKFWQEYEKLPDPFA